MSFNLMNFGKPTTANTNFGTFGSSNNAPNMTQNTSFGNAPNPSMPTFSGAWSTNTNATNLGGFSQPAAFSNFGAQPATTGFGAPINSNPSFGSGFGVSNMTTAPTGTRATKYQMTRVPEVVVTAGQKKTVNTNFTAITAMSQYSSKSFEEWRWEDLCANNVKAGGGQPKQPMQQMGFGQMGLNNTVMSKPPDMTTGFGTNSAFGAKPQMTGFGSPTTNTLTPTSSTGFGSTNPATPTHMGFGNPNTSVKTNTTGFGTPTNPTANTSVYGMNNSLGTTGGGFGTSLKTGFGVTSSAPSAGFGAAAKTGTSLMSNNTAQPTFFGTNTNTGTLGSGGFGQANSAVTSAFGQNTTARSGFGQPGTSTTTLDAKPGFGFGLSPQQPQMGLNLRSGFGAGNSLTATPNTANPISTNTFSPSTSTLTPTSTSSFGLLPGNFASSNNLSGFGQVPSSQPNTTPGALTNLSLGGGATSFSTGSAPGFGNFNTMQRTLAPTSWGSMTPSSTTTVGIGNVSTPSNMFGNIGGGVKFGTQANLAPLTQETYLTTSINQNPFGVLPKITRDVITPIPSPTTNYAKMRSPATAAKIKLSPSLSHYKLTPKSDLTTRHRSVLQSSNILSQQDRENLVRNFFVSRQGHIKKLVINMDESDGSPLFNREIRDKLMGNTITPTATISSTTTTNNNHVESLSALPPNYPCNAVGTNKSHRDHHEAQSSINDALSSKTSSEHILTTLSEANSDALTSNTHHLQHDSLEKRTSTSQSELPSASHRINSYRATSFLDASPDISTSQLDPPLFHSKLQLDQSKVLCPFFTKSRHYYTIPPMEELQTFNEDQLQNVTDFVVGHEKYGFVIWPGKTDVRYLDLNSIAQFNSNNVEIYPDEETKPSCGEQLNKTAHVTLYVQYPKDPIKSAHFESQLLDKNKELKGDWNSRSRTWSFTVEHFTKYGLDSESESSDPKMIEDSDHHFLPVNQAMRELPTTNRYFTSTKTNLYGISRDPNQSGSDQSSSEMLQADDNNWPNRNKASDHYTHLQEPSTYRMHQGDDPYSSGLSEEVGLPQEEEGEVEQEGISDERIMRSMWTQDGGSSHNQHRHASLFNAIPPSFNNTVPSISESSFQHPANRCTVTDSSSLHFRDVNHSWRLKPPLERPFALKSSISPSHHDSNLTSSHHPSLGSSMISNNYPTLTPSLSSSIPFGLKMPLGTDEPQNKKFRSKGMTGPMVIQESTINKFLTQPPLGNEHVDESILASDGILNRISIHNNNSYTLTPLVPSVTSKNNFQVSLNDSVVANKQDHFIDQGLFMGRSFRVGWTSNGILVHSGRPTSFHPPCPVDGVIEDYLLNYQAKCPLDSNDPTAVTPPVSCTNSFSNVYMESIKKLIHIDSNTHYFSMLDAHLKHARNLLNDNIYSIATIRQDSPASSLDTLPVFNLDQSWNQYIDKVEQIEALRCQDAMASVDQNLISSTLRQRDEHSRAHKHFMLVFKLLKTLFGEFPTEFKFDDLDFPKNDNTCSYVENLVRRHLLDAWLQEATLEAAKQQLLTLSKIYPGIENEERCGWEAIAVLLSAKCLTQAVQVALSMNEPRLALLLAQMTSPTSLKFNMSEQLTIWFRAGILNRIEPYKIRIYSIMAGQVDVTSVSYTYWLQVIASYFWYAAENPVSQPIIDALTQYNRAISPRIDRLMGHSKEKTQLEMHSKQQTTTELQSSSSSILKTTAKEKTHDDPPLAKFSKDSMMDHETLSLAMPVPTYLLHLAKSQLLPFKYMDTLYHLLQLYCDSSYPLVNVLHPLGHTMHILDHHLSWHLYSVIKSLNLFPIFEREADLSLAYATQLECMGLWQWAVYVLLSLPPSLYRSTVIRHFINRHIAEVIEDNQLSVFLIEQLGIPENWLNEAQVWYCHYTGMLQMEIDLLIKTHQWEMAHELTFSDWAPQLLLQCQYSINFSDSHSVLLTYLDTGEVDKASNKNQYPQQLSIWPERFQLALQQLEQHYFVNDFQYRSKLYLDFGQLFVNLKVMLTDLNAHDPSFLAQRWSINERLNELDQLASNLSARVSNWIEQVKSLTNTKENEHGYGKNRMHQDPAVFITLDTDHVASSNIGWIAKKTGQLSLDQSDSLLLHHGSKKLRLLIQRMAVSKISNDLVKMMMIIKASLQIFQVTEDSIFEADKVNMSAKISDVQLPTEDCIVLTSSIQHLELSEKVKLHTLSQLTCQYLNYSIQMQS